MNETRKTNRKSFWTVGSVVIAITAMVSTAHAQVIFLYDAADASLPVVSDSGGNGNDGAVVGDEGSFLEGVKVVDDAPAEFSGGSSFEFDSTTDRINSDAIDLMDNAGIVAAGGYTMDAWIKTEVLGFGLGSSASIIDYAGTEGIQFNATGEVIAKITDGGATLVSSVNVIDGEWHRVTATFTVTDGSNLAAVIGDLSITVDGVTEDPVVAATMSDFGDSLDRPTSVGGHPRGFTGDIYVGRIFNPSITLGTGGGVVGDANGDGNFDFGDIEAFFLALTDPAAYAVQFPNVALNLLDMNADGNTDFGDIDAFFVALTAG